MPAYVTFSTAQTTATIILAATDDATNDVDETVVLGFGALPDGFTAGVRPTATVTIIAADEALTGLWYLDDGSGLWLLIRLGRTTVFLGVGRRSPAMG